MHSDKIKFARFVFFFHWIASGLTLVAIWFAWRLGNSATGETRNAAMVLVAAFALVTWKSARDDRWSIEDAAWHAIGVVWTDAITLVCFPALLLLGVTMDDFMNHYVGLICFAAVSYIPIAVIGLFRR